MSRFAGARAAASRRRNSQADSASIEAQDGAERPSSPPQQFMQTAGTRHGLSVVVQSEAPEKYLKRFGFGVVGIKPQLSLHVMHHEEEDGHTFYELQCSLAWYGHGNEAYVSYLRGPPLAWRCKHRLQDLREELHDPVKACLAERPSLKGTTYNSLFDEAPFARHGGPPGTTARLRLWLDVLARCANNGALPAHLCSLALRFLEAPVPPNSDAALLMEAGRCTVCTLPLVSASGVCSRCQADPSVDCSPRKVPLAASREGQTKAGYGSATDVADTVDRQT